MVKKKELNWEKTECSKDNYSKGVAIEKRISGKQHHDHERLQVCIHKFMKKTAELEKRKCVPSFSENLFKLK